MPELNRDKERLYRPGKLSVVFLVTSGLLLASLAWMVFQDYSREWKGVQKGYYKKRAEVLEAQRQRAREELAKGAEHEELVRLGSRLRAQRDELERNPEVRRLREEIRERRQREKDLEGAFKATSGAWAEKKYELEKVRLEHSEGHASKAEVDRVQAEYDELVAQRRADEEAKNAPAIEAAAKEARLAALEKPLKDLEKEWGRATEKVRMKEVAIAAARAKGESLWRNAFGLDFLVPTIVPQKVVNENVHDDFNFATHPKVDMCMSCHMGMADPAMRKDGDPWLRDTLTRLNVPDVYLAHSHFDLLMGPNSPHKMGEIGCTVCHMGRGWSLDFQRAAHSPSDPEERARWERDLDWAPARWVDFPMLPLPYVQGQCFKCHTDGLYYAPQVLHEEDGVARILSEHERLYRYELEVDPASDPTDPKYRPKTLKQRLLVDGKPVMVGGKAVEVAVPAKGRSVVPPVHYVEERRDDGTVAYRAPVGNERGTPFLPVIAKAPQPQDDAALAKLPGGAWHPQKLESGLDVVTEYGCYGCHLMKDAPRVVGYPRPTGEQTPDFSTPAPGTLAPKSVSAGTRSAPSAAPKVGWDLTHLADKVDRRFLRSWLKNPTSYRIDTRMPAFFWYRHHDEHWKASVRIDEKGQPVPDDRHVEPHPGPKDIVQSEVEIQALSEFLLWASKGRAGEYPEVPEGDARRGSQAFFSAGCYGCHLGPDRWDSPGQDVEQGQWVPDDGARFRLRPDELPQGPRLTAMGSKVNAKWLYAWLAEPRHYWSTTRMPNMRWKDVVGADGTTVLRTADQVRADVVAYLMRGRDVAFEKDAEDLEKKLGAGWTVEHTRMLDDMWIEFYGKGLDPTMLKRRLDTPPESKEGGGGYGDPATEPFETRLGRMGKLASVGEKLVAFRGCFGCHNIAGTESMMPIGKDLSIEGTEDIHKFDFGFVHEIGHTRWEWIDKKIEDPRIYDRGREKRWNEKLKMPKFNLRSPQQRTDVTGFVLGLVKEPIKPGARAQTSEAERDILAGRAVIARYGCNQCHNIEGRKGIVWAEQASAQQELWMLPPNLYGEGNRRKPDWLFHFLKQPEDLRPGVIQRMPMFRLSDEEASALVAYFNRMAERDRSSFDPLDRPLDATAYAEPRTLEYTKSGQKRTATVRNDVEQAKALFDAFNCASCHLPRGTPGADPSQGGSAPPFTVVGKSLRREWIVALLQDPQTQIQGTKMPAFWDLKSVRTRKAGETRQLDQPAFRFECGPDCTNDEVAEAQMRALARYVIHHYEPTVEAPAEPGEGR